MYRRPKFLEVLVEIRQDMAREADYDVDLFAEMIRTGKFSKEKRTYDVNQKKETEKKLQKDESDVKELERS